MACADQFPLHIRVQSVVVKIYRVKAKTAKAGCVYTIAWIGPDGRETRTLADLDEAKQEAELKAAQLAQGLAAGTAHTRADIMELSEARRMAEVGGLPLLSAIAEWSKAREVVGPALLEACHAWADRRTVTITRIMVPTAVAQFIAEKDAAKKQGTRTYESKLKPAAEFFPKEPLDTITTRQWGRYLAQFEDAVTRNDMRKRAVTLCRWAQRHGHLPDDIRPEIEKTERAKETANPIGILQPHEFADLLTLFREKHPRHLAALVIAGLCGVRAEEIHGKRANPERRQRWEDIHIDRKFMSVTAAKENTPSNRVVHLCPAAVAWLKVCPDQDGNHYPHQRGPVCQINAITRIRDIAATAGHTLPENCFRHSWISYRIALTGDKASTATEAGNSVKEIDRRYRVPLPKYLGQDWFASRPERR